MFCPKCRHEYRAGFTVCNSCNVPLVEELPPEPELKFVDYEEILRTYNEADIAMIKCVLEANSIKYFMKGEHFHNLRPCIQPVILMVRKDQIQEVKELLQGIELAYTVISLGDPLD